MQELAGGCIQGPSPVSLPLGFSESQHSPGLLEQRSLGRPPWRLVLAPEPTMAPTFPVSCIYFCFPLLLPSLSGSLGLGGTQTEKVILSMSILSGPFIEKKNNGRSSEGHFPECLLASAISHNLARSS